MEKKVLYRYKKVDGTVVDSLTRPDCEYRTRHRIVADDGKVLTYNGDITEKTVIDVDTVDGWSEADAPTETEEESV